MSYRSIYPFDIYFLAFVLTTTAPITDLFADDFPNQPIKLVLPFPAGSGTDQSARRFAQFASEQFRQPVVVENRPGANGFIASQAVASAKADGYTLLYTTNTTHAANAALFKTLPYDPQKDFAPVSRMAMGGIVVLVSAKSPYRTLDDLITAGRKQPGKITFASGNSSSRIAAEMLAQQSGVSFLHVPYKGIPQAVTDVLAGIVDFVVADAANSISMVGSGQMRALAVTSDSRMAELPDVPTVSETGLRGYSLYVWTAIFAPAKTPTPVLDRLANVIKLYFDSPAGQEAARSASAVGSPTTPDGLTVFVEQETAKWAKAVKEAGIVPE